MHFDRDLRRLREASELRAVAHPLRLAIIEQLGVRGTLTASELAEVLDETPANCSWHLRKLAEHGLVEETHDGLGRRRPWRAVTLGFSFDRGSSADSATRIAGETLREELVQRETERFRSNAARDDTWEVSQATQAPMWLTEDEARALSEELAGIAMRYRDRLRDPERRPEGARLVWTLSLLSVEPE